MKRRALGRGLAALLPEPEEAQESGGLLDLDVNEIRINPRQPRLSFDEVALEELACSVREKGILQPLLVRKIHSETDDSVVYELIAGERRLRAAKRVELEKVPCRILDIDEKASLEIALLENIQREDLDVIEESKGYYQLIQEFSYTQEDLARRIGKSRSHIANVLRMLSLPEAVQAMVQAGQISPGHAKILAGLNEDFAEEIARIIVLKGLTVHKTAALVRAHRFKNSRMRNSLSAQPNDLADEALAISEQLSTLSGLRVELRLKKGEVVFFIKNTEELEQLIDRFSPQG